MGDVSIPKWHTPHRPRNNQHYFLLLSLDVIVGNVNIPSEAHSTQT